jgi:hypothetical protein
LRALAVVLLLTGVAHAQAPPPTSLLDVPYLSQSEALCGGAAAAMVLRYWGERGLDAESFAHLVDASKSGIRTDALTAAIAQRGWIARPLAGDPGRVVSELMLGRPVLALIEDRPGRYHYIVVVSWPGRGVVFHDPARAPFRVMARDEFVRRWRAAGSWMLVVVPGDRGPRRSAPPDDVARTSTVREDECDGLVTAGVRAAQANDLAGAERSLTSALACAGPAAYRELAGVRLLQRRWPDVAELASTAVAADPSDAHAWKLLGTSRYVQDDRRGALAAWNRAGEPRVDLVRVDGLTRTRHRAVENLLGIDQGDLLTSGSFARARRRLLELPSAVSARLEFVPAPQGRAEVHGAVNEREPFPATPLAFAGIGLTAAAMREVRVSLGSVTGGGESVDVAWRFWERRPRAAFAVRAPAPWGGVWGIEAAAERQPFDAPGLPAAESRGVRLGVANWATAAFRWELQGGVDDRRSAGRFGVVDGSLAFVSAGDKVEARAGASRWQGGRAFGMGHASLLARSRVDRRGVVILGAASMWSVSQSTPRELWAAGDTGHARPTLLRAHPVLADGRLRTDRLGRTLVSATAEAQRWRARILGPIRAAAASFVDVARTAHRVDADAVWDVDVGIGARIAAPGLPGIFRLDLAKGLREGATALSFAYQP